MSTTEHHIRNGKLTVTVNQSEMTLDELLAFASRENPKRGYLFVSKVLGKHWPVRPFLMRETYERLAHLVGQGASTYVVGMAETATGLGAGVADSLSRQQDRAVYYQHTTRHELPRDIWLQLDESHSHAVDHILYQPSSSIYDEITHCERLVLVDDEISTGRTLHLLGEQLLNVLPQVKEVVIVSLVNWLQKEDKKKFTQWPCPVRFISLLEGHFEYQAKPNITLQLPQRVDNAIAKVSSRTDLGRLAIRMPYQGELPALDPSQPLTVIGDGEHLYLPFLAAEQVELQGQSVLFQSTTRSPIMLGDGIRHKLAFSIDERDVEHYLYNFQPNERQVMHFIEDESQRCCHQFSKHYPLQHLQTSQCG